jgi:hypothetical protein
VDSSTTMKREKAEAHQPGFVLRGVCNHESFVEVYDTHDSCLPPPI